MKGGPFLGAGNVTRREQNSAQLRKVGAGIE